jgi:hypothetical protein
VPPRLRSILAQSGLMEGNLACISKALIRPNSACMSQN